MLSEICAWSQRTTEATPVERQSGGSVPGYNMHDAWLPKFTSAHRAVVSCFRKYPELRLATQFLNISQNKVVLKMKENIAT